MSVSNTIIDGIEIIANDFVEKAGYDKTIQAQILSCEDATIGKYRCRYQDAIFYAYTNNTDLSFSNGAYVYILVPNGDMGKEKTILGTTKKLGIDYISQAEGEQAYDIIGNNNITSQDKYYLNTNNENYKYIIYKAESSNNDIIVDQQALKQYIQQSSSIIVGAKIKTSIPLERQSRGHYGITYNLLFNDAVSEKEVIRSYTIDEDNMIDDPYRLIYETRQYQIFEVDGPNFIRLESIQIFNKQFPNANGKETNNKLSEGDIQFSDLQLSGAIRMSDQEINGVAISFYTPQGTFFSGAAAEGDKIKIVAQVRVKGKLVSEAQNIPFYWGIQNISVNQKNIYYNQFLGRGWKCLNQYNLNEITEIVINEDGEEQLKTIETNTEWIPSNNTFIFKYEDATARNNRIKVAINYNGTVISKEITIQNLNTAIPQLTIQSNNGTKFYYDIGHPTLTCKVNGGEPNDYKYIWGYESNKGVFNELPETENQNSQYNNIVTQLQDLQEAIAAGNEFANINAERITELQASKDVFDYIQRVEKNKVYNVQIRNITLFGTFKCSVYNDKNIYLGTASIKLTNSFDNEDLYSLVINNGSVTFQYDENGIAPNNKSLNIQQQIKALTFTIYDNLGQPIDDEIVSRNCKIRWAVPIKETMINDKQENSSGTDAQQNYIYYDDRTILLYDIAQRYNIKNQRNQIKLTVDYKGMNLVAETQFSFIKQGEPGTNGTEYVVKLVPNTEMNNPPLWPMITKIGTGSNCWYQLNYILKDSSNNIGRDYIVGGLSSSLLKPFFKAQLWHNGELIWQGTNLNITEPEDQQPLNVYWDILKNNSDDSLFEIERDTGIIKIKEKQNKGYFLTDQITDEEGNNKTVFLPYSNIVKCTINWREENDGQIKSYYGTIPITFAETTEKFRVALKDYTGWRYAIYTSDGASPQYDNSHPFEFTCMQNIEYQNDDGITSSSWEDISLNPNEQYAIDYEISSVGPYKSYLNEDEKNLIEVLNKIAYTRDCQKNQRKARPATRYNGLCVNAAVTCLFRQHVTDGQGQIIGRINVPIRFLLNKYGLANLNDWDGNSIEIKQNEGYILAPQMGAGKKNTNNTFTGVLMGEVNTPGKNKSDIGLLGYSDGDRTFFLNSQYGSALFGKSDNGQIIIDPTQSKAMLYSGNFWNEGNYDQNGLPKDYGYRNKDYAPKEGICAKEGMIIDLSTPEIFFGSGKFYVNKDGEMHAAGGGTIGGWKIGDTSLTGGTINIDSAGKIYSGNHNELGSYADGFFLSENGLSIGSKVKIDKTGVMKLGSGAVSDSSNSCWTIDGSDTRSYIAFGGNKKLKESTVYLGTDGISLGNDKFSVSQRGELTSKSGTIGGWKIDGSILTAQNITLSSAGFLKGAEIKDENGKVTNYAWSIGTNGSAVFNNLTANGSGTIGGWKINPAQYDKNGKITSYAKLSAGNMYLSSDGSVRGSNWSITKDGTANFQKLSGIVPGGFTINVTGTGSISGKGMGIGGGSAGSYVNPNQVGYGAGSNQTLYQGLKADFDSLYAKKAEVGNLSIDDFLSYNKKSVNWGQVVTNIANASVTKEDGVIKSFSIGVTTTQGLVRPSGAKYHPISF